MEANNESGCIFCDFGGGGAGGLGNSKTIRLIRNKRISFNKS